MPFIERHGHRIHYEVHGPAHAPPLLLIMGLGLSSQAWDTLPVRLQRHFRVVVFDNRGTGRSGPVGATTRMCDLADDAMAVLHAAGVRSGAGAYVFGISMGGMIAQELALRHPHHVRALVLGATFASWLRSHKAEMAVALRLLAVNLAGPRAVHQLADILASPDFNRRNPKEIGRWLLRGGVGPRLAVFGQLAAVVNHSTLGRLHHIAAPTLVVTGSADRLVPPANSRILHARIAGARLVELHGAGHVFPLEREEETVEVLESHFLGGAAR